MNVGSVRQRLTNIGEIVSVTPQVREQGEIAFSFVIVTDAPESVFADWQRDSLTFVLMDDDAAAEFGGTEETAIDETGAPEATSANRLLSPSNVVRVDLARLDELMRMIAELVVSPSASRRTASRCEDKAISRRVAKFARSESGDRPSTERLASRRDARADGAGQ